MKSNEREPLAPRSNGLANGLIGVLMFSGSLPATRVAVAHLDPFFVTSARAAIAALLAGLGLMYSRQPRPGRGDLWSLATVSLTVVLGFPLLTGLAMTRISAARGLTLLGMLPLATALAARVRSGERPRFVFWLFAGVGAAVVGVYANASRSTTGSKVGDALMLAAILSAGIGYAEGAKLARRMGGWQVISWALLLALPLSGPFAISTRPVSPAGIDWYGWTALAYVTIFSMLLGFLFWYRGLAEGGIARIGQLQLLQPFLGFVLAAVLLGERIEGGMILASLLVMLCVIGTTWATAPQPDRMSALRGAP